MNRLIFFAAIVALWVQGLSFALAPRTAWSPEFDPSGILPLPPDFVLRVKESLKDYPSFESFLKQLKPEIDEEKIPKEALFLGLKRALYHASRDNPLLKANVHHFISKLIEKRTGSFTNKLGLYLREAYDVKNRKLVFISTEADPFHTTGGLGTLLGEFPKALAGMGFQVTVVTPYYQHFTEQKAKDRQEAAIDKYGFAFESLSPRFKVRGDTEYQEGLQRGRVDGVEYVLLHNREMFDWMYGGFTSSEKTDRFVALARGSIEALKALKIKPLLIYANDAASGYLPVILSQDPFIRSDAQTTDWHSRTVLIVHNPDWRYHNQFPVLERGVNNLEAANLPGDLYAVMRDPQDPSKINQMAGGMRTATHTIAVSPTTAKEVMTRKDGLEKVGRFVEGISNCIPAGYYESAWDHIFKNAEKESAKDVPALLKHHEGLKQEIASNPILLHKIKNRFPDILKSTEHLLALTDSPQSRYLRHIWLKLTIQKMKGFKMDPDIPLVTMIHRITDQKGFDLVLQAQHELMQRFGEVQILFGGKTDYSDPDNKRIHDALETFAKTYPGNVSFVDGFADMRFYAAGSDGFLMPSKDEPGGISNQEAAALGNMVVAHAIGGLRDRVIPVQVVYGKHNGNGYLFSDYTRAGFLNVFDSMIQSLRSKDDMEKMEAREWAINNVHPWEEAAQEYLDSMYRQLEIVEAPLSRQDPEALFQKAA